MTPIHGSDSAFGNCIPEAFVDSDLPSNQSDIQQVPEAFQVLHRSLREVPEIGSDIQIRNLNVCERIPTEKMSSSLRFIEFQPVVESE